MDSIDNMGYSTFSLYLRIASNWHPFHVAYWSSKNGKEYGKYNMGKKEDNSKKMQLSTELCKHYFKAEFIKEMELY